MIWLLSCLGDFPQFPDGDGDGFSIVEDCDDDDNTAFPGAFELCDGLDDDCDGLVDEGTDGQLEWFEDIDQDGYGNAEETITACEAPYGYASVSGDCDDRDGDSYPGAVEVFNGRDDDCDGSHVEGSGQLSELAFARIDGPDGALLGRSGSIATHDYGFGSTLVVGSPSTGERGTLWLLDSAVEDALVTDLARGDVVGEDEQHRPGFPLPESPDILGEAGGNDLIFIAGDGSYQRLYGIEHADLGPGLNTSEHRSMLVQSWPDTTETPRLSAAAVFDDELAVGLPWDQPDLSSTRAGLVSVFHGPFEDGLYVRQSWASDRFYGEEGHEMGFSLSHGDLDANGLDELFVGAPGVDDGAGAVFRMDVAEYELDPYAATRISGAAGEALGGEFGLPVVEDLDGDGVDDLVALSPRAGRVFVFTTEVLGELSSSDADQILDGPIGFGASFAVFDGSLAVGSPDEDVVYLFDLDAGVGAAPWGELHGEVGAETGAALTVGDFDHDGTDDLVVGAPASDDGGALFTVLGW